MTYRVLIPARLGSTRLPNKPLKDIFGKSLIQRVVEQVKKSNAMSVHVATDSIEVINHCNELKIESLLTSSDHKTGSDRLSESCKILNLKDDELIINVQGDEPFIDPVDIDNLAALANIEETSMITLFSSLKQNELQDQNVVKLWMQSETLVRDFARDIDHMEPAKAKKHIGIYAYRVNFLNTFVTLQQTSNEITRNLEQMRALDNGKKIYARESVGEYHLGVDTELDLNRAIEIAKKLV